MGVAKRATRRIRAKVPAAAADDLQTARAARAGIDRRLARIWTEVVGCPLPHIPMHVEQAPCIGRECTDAGSARPLVLFADIRLRLRERVASREGGGGSRAAGILPLGLGGQPVPARGLARVQSPEKLENVMEVHSLDRKFLAACCEATRIRAHDAPPLALGHLVSAELEVAGQGHLVPALLRLAMRLGRRGPHEEGSARDGHELHPGAGLDPIRSRWRLGSDRPRRGQGRESDERTPDSHGRAFKFLRKPITRPRSGLRSTSERRDG